ncbi:MAG TPA: hypothetical protein VGB89_12225 [Bacteroidota bacterium]
MKQSLRTLLAHSIDYAGLFPPASLDMKQVVRNYAAYRKSSESWLLARLIVPVSRLDEFVVEQRELDDQNGQSDPWLLSVLPGKDLSGDITTILNFNKEYGKSRRVEVLELKAGTKEEIVSASNLIPKTWDVFFEVEVNQLPLIQAIREQGRKAKIRTGGIAEGLIPSSAHIARFLATCIHEGVPMKATAGLHHPLRAEQKLTYSPDSRSAIMHGFLNVFLAAALLQGGATVAEATELIEEQDSHKITIGETSIRWRSWELSIDRLANIRKTFLAGFGSCSFRDPIDDLATLHLV